LRYLADTLAWVPTSNPAKQNEPGYGLNWWGPTIIDQQGGLLFAQIIATWAQLFSYGPAMLKLRGLFSWQVPLEQVTYSLNEDQSDQPKSYDYPEIERDGLVLALTTLAQFGQQAATREFFILHTGI
jgi:hypothetical protein